MMNEIPEGFEFEIVELGAVNEIKAGDRLGRLKIESNATTLGFVDSEGYWHPGNRELQTALAAANYRVLRKKKPPEPVVIEGEIDVELNSDGIRCRGYGDLWVNLCKHQYKKFRVVATEIQEAE